jgi:hypothetical protein
LARQCALYFLTCFGPVPEIDAAARFVFFKLLQAGSKTWRGSALCKIVKYALTTLKNTLAFF